VDLPAVAGGVPVRGEYLVFGRPVIEQPEIDEVVDSMRSAWLGTGPKVGRFEEMVRLYVGTDFAKALHSCTAGLQLSLLGVGVGPGDEVITTALTFAATVNAIAHTGATPVLVDVDPATQNLDPRAVEAAVTSRTRAVMPVHMYGRPYDVAAVRRIADRHDLFVIDDAAHAIGAEYQGRRVGSLADVTVFSFYATKNITTGEGGMITTDNGEWARAIETYALHGLSAGAWKRYSDDGFKHYGVVLPGYKYNMMDLQAAIGLHQFPRLESWRERRSEIWSLYDRALKHLPLTLPAPMDADIVHARHLYTILLDLEELTQSRDWIQQALHLEGIGTGIHFLAITEHPYFARVLPYGAGDFPVAEDVSRRTISLPLSPGMTNQDVDDVVTALSRVLGHCRR
jgi:dTDP-4-amino-4,6-dideoxygalactose transaminase